MKTKSKSSLATSAAILATLTSFTLSLEEVNIVDNNSNNGGSGQEEVVVNINDGVGGDGSGNRNGSAAASTSQQRRRLRRHMKVRGKGRAAGAKKNQRKSINRQDNNGQQNDSRHLVIQHHKTTGQQQQQHSNVKPSSIKAAIIASTKASNSNSNNNAPGCGPSSGTHHSPYLGCYLDRKNSRAFPYELYSTNSSNSSSSNSNSNSSKRLGNSVLHCESECTKRGYKYFARQFKGQCFCGNTLDGPSGGGRYGMAAGEGCDCCAENVGVNKMCVWENANHPESQATPPHIDAILPYQIKQSQQQSNTVQPIHTHMMTFGSVQSNTGTGNSHQNNNSNNQVATTSKNSFQQQVASLPKPQPPMAATHKPTSAFRLRLHWQTGYTWQGKRTEKFYCMECRGSCRNGSSIQIDTCHSTEIRQKFIAVGRTIRPASNPSLCLTVTGYSGTRSPVKLRYCNSSRNSSGRTSGSNQNFKELRSTGKFELQPESNTGRCLSQHHHPKPHEVVFPERCDKTRKFDTTYWITH